MGVIVNMRGVGQPVGENTYPVILTKVSSKPARSGNGDIIAFQATIKDSGTEYDGRPLFRNFFLSNDPEKDNSGTLFYLLQALVAFGGDPEDMDSDKFDVEDYAKTLYGNKARATVTHRPNTDDASKPPYLDVQFFQDDL